MHMHNGIRHGKNNACPYPLFPPPDTHANEQWVTVFFSVFLRHTCLTLYAFHAYLYSMEKCKKGCLLCRLPHSIHCHRALSFESFSTKFNTPSKNWASTGQLEINPVKMLTEEKLLQPCNIWIWNVFTHVASGYANFLLSKESIYTGKEFNSHRLGYLHGRHDVMWKRSIPGENFWRIFEDPFYGVDLWWSLLKIFKNLQNSCLRILEGLCKYLEDFCRNLSDPNP